MVVLISGLQYTGRPYLDTVPGNPFDPSQCLFCYKEIIGQLGANGCRKPVPYEWAITELSSIEIEI